MSVPAASIPKHRSLFGNILTNYAGAAWAAVIQLAIIPVFITLLGPKAYGLVAFHLSLLFGLMFLEATSLFFTRDLARLRGGEAPRQEMLNLMATLERVSWGIALLIGVLVMWLAPFIAHRWLEQGGLPPETIETAVRLMGLAIACQWPGFLYSGGFLGAQRHDLLVGTRIVVSTLQFGGGALLLWLVKPDVGLYLGWVAACYLAQSFVMRGMLWRVLRQGGNAKGFFQMKIIRQNWRFAGGTFLIAMTASIMSQADKIIIAKDVPLDEFAAYALCFTLLAQVITLAVTPINNTLLAHFSKLMESSNDAGLRREYHHWTQMNALILLPLLGMLMFFSAPLLRLWLGDETGMAAQMSYLMPLVVGGFLLNGLVVVPYNLQMASGKTRALSITNIMAACFVVGALIIFAPIYGVIAGAAIWFALNVFYYFCWVPLMHSRLLSSELWSWWGKDTLLPATVAGGLFFLSSRLINGIDHIWGQAFCAAGTAGVVFIVLLGVLPLARESARRVAKRCLSFARRD